MAKQKVYYECYDNLLSEMVSLAGFIDKYGNIDDTAALYLIWCPIFSLMNEADASFLLQKVYAKYSTEDWYMQELQQQNIKLVLRLSEMEQEIDQQYRLSDDFDQLGTHWKSFLRERSEKQTRRLIAWIDQYRQELFPPANAVIEKYEDRECRDQRKSCYQEYRAMLLRLQRKLESLADFFLMLDKM